MPESPIDQYELHQKLTALQQHAEAFYRALGPLDDSDFRSFLSTFEQGSAYCSQMLQQVETHYTCYWQFRLALLWDIFPSRRHAVLRFCTATLQKMTLALAETTQKRSTPHLLDRFTLLGEASLLLTPEQDLSTQMFAEATTSLAGTRFLTHPMAARSRWLEDPQSILSRPLPDLPP